LPLRKTTTAIFLALVLPNTTLRSDQPAWWQDRGILQTPGSTASENYAVANLGQAKHMAETAYSVFEEKFQTDLGFTLDSIIPPQLAPGDLGYEASLAANYTPLNVGQLKALATPFYDFLVREAPTWLPLLFETNGLGSDWPHNYPWIPDDPANPDPENYAPANIGQLKLAFSFDFALDSDGDSLYDHWEAEIGSNPTTNDDPSKLDSDGDGLTDVLEEILGTDSLVGDSDNDGLLDREDLFPTVEALNFARNVFPKFARVKFPMVSEAFFRPVLNVRDEKIPAIARYDGLEFERILENGTIIAKLKWSWISLYTTDDATEPPEVEHEVLYEGNLDEPTPGSRDRWYALDPTDKRSFGEAESIVEADAASTPSDNAAYSGYKHQSKFVFCEPGGTFTLLPSKFVGQSEYGIEELSPYNINTDAHFKTTTTTTTETNQAPESDINIEFKQSGAPPARLSAFPDKFDNGLLPPRAGHGVVIAAEFGISKTVYQTINPSNPRVEESVLREAKYRNFLEFVPSSANGGSLEIEGFVNESTLTNAFQFGAGRLSEDYYYGWSPHDSRYKNKPSTDHKFYRRNGNSKNFTFNSQVPSSSNFQMPFQVIRTNTSDSAILANPHTLRYCFQSTTGLRSISISHRYDISGNFSDQAIRGISRINPTTGNGVAPWIIYGDIPGRLVVNTEDRSIASKWARINVSGRNDPITGSRVKIPGLSYLNPSGWGIFSDNSSIWANGHRVSIDHLQGFFARSVIHPRFKIRGNTPQGLVAVQDSWFPDNLAVLLPVELSVDKNGDGEVGGAADFTSNSDPFRFWINNDQDSNIQGASGSTGGTAVWAVSEEVVPVVNADSSNERIEGMRDLEDFERLRISIAGLDKAIAAGTIQVGLKFENVQEGDPSIKVYRAADQQLGSDDYLHDESIASQQAYLTDITVGGSPAGSPNGEFSNSVATVGKTSISWIDPEAFAAFDANSGVAHFIFEGVSPGRGELALSLRKGGQIIGGASVLDMKLMDVKSMYERVKATPDHPDSVPQPSDYSYPHENPPEPNMGWEWNPGNHAYQADPKETKDYVIFVHGWRMTYDGAHNFGETTFKRLWRSGFRGRFAFMRWPTYSEDTHQTTDALFTYNNSDYRAWKSGKSLKSFVNSLSPEYTRSLAAHSMGNIVAGSALREGMEVDTYALLNAAVPAMCYDGRSSLYSNTYTTPDGDTDSRIKRLGFKDQITATNGAVLVNFFLPLDSALSAWETNNRVLKPQFYNFGINGYYYDPSKPGQSRVGLTFALKIGRDVRTFHEAAALATQSRTKTAGALGGTRGVINSFVDLNGEYGFGNTHSAEWNFSYARTREFYKRLLNEFAIDVK